MTRIVRLAKTAFCHVQRLPARLVDRLRRRRLIASMRTRAMWNRSTIDLDLHPSMRLGRSVSAVVFPRTHTVLTIGRDVVLGDRLVLRLKGGDATIGDGCDLRNDVNLSIGGRLLLEGDNVISWGSVIHCDDSVFIGLHAMLAEYCSVADSAHFYTAPDVAPHLNLRTAPVRIGRGVWLCPKVTVASGVTIGDHTIVGSGSAVTSDLPGGHLAGGLPAVPLRRLDLPWEQSCSGDGRS